MNEIIVRELLSRIEADMLNTDFKITVSQDKVFSGGGRLYLQVSYWAPCTKAGLMKEWKGRKWYLSEYMTEDEVVKTAFAAFKAAVEHEIMEGFKVDGKILFNPHVSYEALLSVSDQEVQREEIIN